MTTMSATQGSYPTRTSRFGRSQKKLSPAQPRRCLGRELHELIQEAKKMASQIQQPPDLWDLEHYLSERRKEIDRKYDYRYSRLTTCLGNSCTKVGSVRKSCAG